MMILVELADCWSALDAATFVAPFGAVLVASFTVLEVAFTSFNTSRGAAIALEQHEASFLASPPTSLPPTQPELFALPDEHELFEISANENKENELKRQATINLDKKWQDRRFMI